MKKLLLLFLLLPSLSLNAQNPCDYNLFLNFEDTNCLSHLSIDTTHFKHNIWQIGHAEKAGIDSLACKTKVIVTDTMHPYPVNDTSVFIIKNMVTPGFYYDCRLFSGQYYVQTDSLKDFGKIEFSADHGTTWIDIINNSAYSSTFQWYTKPVLTGHSRTCKSFDGMFCDLGSVFHLQIGDTVMFRFSFISDSIFDNSAGLMFDNFEFIDFIEGISEIRFTPIKSMIFPNPGKGVFTIEFEAMSAIFV